MSDYNYHQDFNALAVELRRIADALEKQKAGERYTMELQKGTPHPCGGYCEGQEERFGR